MPKTRDVFYADGLPEVDSIVEIEIPELGFPFETKISGRMPYNFPAAVAKTLPNETVKVKEAIFGLAFAPARFDTKLVHTITGWRMFHKDSNDHVIVQVNVFPRFRH
jgi:hypothetical protein